MLEPYCYRVGRARVEAGGRSSVVGRTKRGGMEMGSLLVIGARIFRRILKDVGRASGKTTVREDAHRNLGRIDLWEGWEPAGPKVWTGMRGRRRRRRSGGWWDES